MLSLYKISPNNTDKRTKKVSNTIFDNNSQLNFDVKRPQMTSNDFKTTSNEPGKNKKNIVKGGSVHDNIQIKQHYLDEILHNIHP